MIQYPEFILDYFYHCDNYLGSLDAHHPQVYTARKHSPSENEAIQLQVQIKDNKIIQARFRCRGSVAAIASSAFLCEWLENKTITEARGLDTQQFLSLFPLPAEKHHIAFWVIDLLHQLFN